jgi:hypothetical protein
MMQAQASEQAGAAAAAYGDFLKKKLEAVSHYVRAPRRILSSLLTVCDREFLSRSSISLKHLLE